MIDYFLIAHQPDLIDKFPTDNLPNFSGLLVGNNHNESIKYTICRNLPINIESQYHLCSYTGWYAVSKNKLNNHKIICLLEYDVDINNQFHIFNLNLLNNSKTIIAYNYTLFNHYVFYKSVPWLEISLKKIYNISLYDFVINYQKQYSYWPTTTNITMHEDTLNHFVEWFTPMTKCFQHDAMGAYVHERAFFIFCVIHNIQIIYPNKPLLIHHQARSHGTHDFYGAFLNKKNTKILSESMLEEYDRLYDLEMKRCLLT